MTQHGQEPPSLEPRNSLPPSSSSSSRTVRTAWAAWIGFGLLLALHLDFWRPRRAEIWFGWMPEELLWRLGWMVLAFLYLWFFCSRVWRED